MKIVLQIKVHSTGRPCDAAWDEKGWFPAEARKCEWKGAQGMAYRHLAPREFSAIRVGLQACRQRAVQ